MNAEIQALIHEAYQDGLKNGVTTLSEWRRIAYLVVELETVCDMEGLEGFYLSYVGDLASETARALETIGATQSSQLITRANAVFGNSGDASEVFDSFNEAQLNDFDRIEIEFTELLEERSQKLEDYVTRGIST